MPATAARAMVATLSAWPRMLDGLARMAVRLLLSCTVALAGVSALNPCGGSAAFAAARSPAWTAGARDNGWVRPPLAASRLPCTQQPGLRSSGEWLSGIRAVLRAAVFAAAALPWALRRHRGGVRKPSAGMSASMPWKVPNSQQWMWLDVRELMLRERILFVNEYLDESYVNATIAMLLYLQSEDPQKPIQVYLAVPGGTVKPSLALYDTMCELKARGCRISTVAYSLCAGLGPLLLSAGSAGRRFATPNALLRLSSGGLPQPLRGQAAEIAIETRQMLREGAGVVDAFVASTGRDAETIRRDLRRDFYLSATEAVDYGLVDRVLTPNVDKGRVLDDGLRDPWSGHVTRAKVAFGQFADPNQPRTAV